MADIKLVFISSFFKEEDLFKNQQKHLQILE